MQFRSLPEGSTPAVEREKNIIFYQHFLSKQNMVFIYYVLYNYIFI